MTLGIIRFRLRYHPITVIDVDGDQMVINYGDQTLIGNRLCEAAPTVIGG